MTSAEGRTAIRRMNQMHRCYAISNDDIRYVLATFVVMPIRWMDDYGWRRMTEIERIAGANYYRELGRHMGIRDIPATWQAFAGCSTPTSASTSASTPVAGRSPRRPSPCSPPSRPTTGCRRAWSDTSRSPPWTSRCSMRSRFRAPVRVLRTLVRGGLKARGRVVRLLPPRREPFFARQLPQIRTLPRRLRRRRSRHVPARLPGAARRDRSSDNIRAKTAASSEWAGPKPGSWAMVPVPATAPGRSVGVVGGGRVHVPAGCRIPAGPSSRATILDGLSGGMLLALAMNRRARGLADSTYSAAARTGRRSSPDSSRSRSPPRPDAPPTR